MGNLRTITDLGADNDTTFKTVKKRLDAAGVTPIKTEGRKIFYDSAEANRAIWASPAASGSNGLILDDERALLIVEQRKKLERENKIADGENAPIEILREVLARVCCQIASTLDALPLTLKKRSPGLGAKDIELVRKEIAKCRNMAAKAVIDEAKS